MIELHNVIVKHAGRVVLDIPEMRFEEGKRYGIIGENGSGKTTLLRLLAGTLQPDMGTITGIDRTAMGYLPQNPYAFSFSVLRNVEMALGEREDKTVLAQKALKTVGLENFAEARGDKLSGGESQRMGLARIIAIPRKYLLLDEPTSATDIRGMDQIERMLFEYIGRTGSTLIFSTHSPAQALRLAEEVLYLEAGKLVEHGEASQVLRDPCMESTKAFLQHWRI